MKEAVETGKLKGWHGGYRMRERPSGKRAVHRCKKETVGSWC